MDGEEMVHAGASKAGFLHDVSVNEPAAPAAYMARPPMSQHAAPRPSSTSPTSGPMAPPRVRDRIPSATHRCMSSGAVLLEDQSQEILWSVRRCGLLKMGSGKGGHC